MLYLSRHTSCCNSLFRIYRQGTGADYVTDLSQHRKQVWYHRCRSREILPSRMHLLGPTTLGEVEKECKMT